MPRTAVAAATCGETRWVRPPGPWRPSKLRLEVDALRSCGASLSGFMPRHIEQPASRHSAPASVKTWSRPSAMAARRTRTDPGTTSMRTPSATCRPRITSAAARRSSMRPLVQEPRKTVSTATSRIGVPAVRPMYSRALAAAAWSEGSAKSAGSGTVAEQGNALAGVGPPGDERAELAGVDDDLGVERRVVVGDQRAPVGDGGVPVLRPRAPSVAALDVGEGRLVGGDHPGAGAGLDRHVADRHPRLHAQAPDGLAAVLQHVALAAAGADPGDHGQDQVLGGDALGQRALHGDRHRLEGLERQRLGGQHVLDLGGADAEGQRAEGAVGGGVRVAAHDRHARLGQAQLRADHVHDALIGTAQ